MQNNYKTTLIPKTMIVVDIETSGLDPVRCGIWQIGALELENPENTFLEESKIDPEDAIEQEALTVTGKTEQELRNPEKQSQKQLLENFFSWVSKIENKILIAHNAPFDLNFLEIKARKFNIKVPFGHRSFDLHNIASLKYFQLNGQFLIQEGKSKMDLSKVLNLCGLQDNREAHNALEDAKLEAECFSRLVYSKPLLEEFKQFPIPENLK